VVWGKARPEGEASRFQAFASRMEDMCRNRGVVPLSEIDELARKEGIRGAAVIDELAVTEGFEVDYQRGVIVCR